MKPRTKLQLRVIGLSGQLPNINDMMIAWAKKDCLTHKGFATKSRVICMECGQRFSPELVKRKRAVCPHCGASLKIEQSRKRTDKQSTYIAKAEICEEFQVIRCFELNAYYREGKESYCFIHEVLQHWIKDNGNREVVARAMNMGATAWCGDLEIRKKTIDSYYSYGFNDVYCERYHPSSSFKPMYKRMGIDYRLKGMSFLTAINTIPNNPKAETLIKARRYELLDYFDGHSSNINQYWPSIKICLRNKYVIKDVKIWFDYLDLLRHFNKDLHNAHYVCPANLNKEHDKLVAKKRRIQEREEAERKRKKAIENEKKYQKLKSKFFGLSFTDGLIKVKVLESVEEFVEEGDVMHHCVFTNEYYLRRDSLILSARIKDKRIETIEVDLKKLDIVQSRGVCNKNTEYHDRIIKLVKKNMNLIRQKLTA